MIRVLLADDHAALRMGLERLLQDDPEIEVVGAAPEGATAVSLAAELHPDVILMDLSMPGMSGTAATRKILAARPETRVIILTTFSERQDILDAIDAGAVGYLLKDGEPGDILRGIHSAARGDVSLAPRAARELLAARMSRRPADGLTPREREVLVLAARGLPNKQIAQCLAISEKTVKAHLTNVFQRIGVEDRTQAAIWAERNGLLPPGGRQRS